MKAGPPVPQMGVLGHILPSSDVLQNQHLLPQKQRPHGTQVAFPCSLMLLAVHTCFPIKPPAPKSLSQALLLGRGKVEVNPN